MEWLSDPRVLEWARLAALLFVAITWTLILVRFHRRRKARRTKGAGG